MRTSKHIARLDIDDVAAYRAWCREHGFSDSVRKSWAELEVEWCAHRRDLEVARARHGVDRDPAKALERVCTGALAARDLARPRWRALAARIERARLDATASARLRALVESARKNGKLLLADARFGDDVVPLIDGLVGLSRRHAQWIRSPAAWRPRTHNARRQFGSLARHLVGGFPVPEFMDAAWLRSDREAERFRDWYVLIASGGNIRHGEAPIALTKRIVHHFLLAPPGYSIEQALRWGQIRALGGAPGLVDAVVATRLGAAFEHESFWSTVLRFLIASPEIAPAQVGPVVDYLACQRFAHREVFVARGVRETLPPPQPNLTMRGRSPRALLREVEAWHRELAREGARTDEEWERSGIGELELEIGKRGENLRIWTIRELLSTRELVHEGQVMRHCVASYAPSCVAGHCSIWTVELQGYEGTAKKLTLEVRDRTIVQWRKKFNAEPSAQDRRIVRLWAEREDLRISKVI